MNRFYFYVSLSIATLSTGCNFIFNPEKSDDVVRCSNATECEKNPQFAFTLEDARVNATCAAKQGTGAGSLGSSKTNQVCSVNYAEVSCSISTYGGGQDGGSGNPDSKHPFIAAYTQAMDQSDIYFPCTEEHRGEQGCLPSGNQCNEGLVVNDYGFCDVEGTFPPAYGISPEQEKIDQLRAQDVYDQFCRSLFCDERFTCVASGNVRLCQICDPDKPPGEGGCGDLYLNGKRSSVYLSTKEIEESACAAPIDDPLTAADKTEFGLPNSDS